VSPNGITLQVRQPNNPFIASCYKWGYLENMLGYYSSRWVMWNSRLTIHAIIEHLCNISVLISPAHCMSHPSHICDLWCGFVSSSRTTTLNAHTARLCSMHQTTWLWAP
jgi:hypothetical protein